MIKKCKTMKSHEKFTHLETTKFNQCVDFKNDGPHASGQIHHGC